MSSCLVVQHVEAEGSYAIGEALSSAGVVVDTRRMFAGDPLPVDASSFDGLVVMGGPMSVIEDTGFPTRVQEIDLMSDALARGVPCLGVCLGAQIMAVGAGGSVSVGTSGPEIGWGVVDLTAASITDPMLSGLPGRLRVLHWHGDTFALPAHATHLASSPQYENQAFRVGERAWGFQFHFEVNQLAVERFVEVFGDEVRSAGLVPGDITRAAGTALSGLGPIRDRICGRFARLVAQYDRDQDLVDFG